MSSKVDKDLDDLMVKVDSMKSDEKSKSKEEPKQEVDTKPEEAPEESGDEVVDDSSNDQEGEEAPEELGLKTDKIDYPEDDEEEQEMDAEAKKLPEIDDIAHGYDDEEIQSDVDSNGESVDNEEDILSKSLLKLKGNSLSGKVETISLHFKERFPQHEICCITKDKVYSLYDGKAHETMYRKDKDAVEFNQPIRNQELEEQKSSNDAIIEKLLNFDNILQ